MDRWFLLLSEFKGVFFHAVNFRFCIQSIQITLTLSQTFAGNVFQNSSCKSLSSLKSVCLPETFASSLTQKVCSYRDPNPPLTHIHPCLVALWVSAQTQQLLCRNLNCCNSHYSCESRNFSRNFVSFLQKRLPSIWNLLNGKHFPVNAFSNDILRVWICSWLLVWWAHGAPECGKGWTVSKPRQRFGSGSQGGPSAVNAPHVPSSLTLQAIQLAPMQIGPGFHFQEPSVVLIRHHTGKAQQLER